MSGAYTGVPNAEGADATAAAASSVLGLMKSAKEKWNASGANEAVGRVTAAIPDSTKTYVSSMFSRDQLRGVTVFFGIGEERPFYVEKTPSLLVERLKHNFTFFYLNYLLSTSLFFILTLMTSPKAIFGMLILGAVWAWFVRASSSGTLTVGAVSVPQKTASIGLGAVSVFMLFFLLENVFWYAFFWSGLVAGVHAFLRDASMHKDLDDQIAMEGEVTTTALGQEDTFFNDNGV